MLGRGFSLAIFLAATAAAAANPDYKPAKYDLSELPSYKPEQMALGVLPEWTFRLA